MLARNRVDPERLAFIEIDESFAASPLILMKKLRIPREKVNAAGGSLVFGDGLGGSGPRMLIHLCELLKEDKGDLGVVVGYSSGSQSTALLVRKVKF